MFAASRDVWNVCVSSCIKGTEIVWSEYDVNEGNLCGDTNNSDDHCYVGDKGGGDDGDCQGYHSYREEENEDSENCDDWAERSENCLDALKLLLKNDNIKNSLEMLTMNWWDSFYGFHSFSKALSSNTFADLTLRINFTLNLEEKGYSPVAYLIQQSF